MASSSHIRTSSSIAQVRSWHGWGSLGLLLVIVGVGAFTMWMAQPPEEATLDEPDPVFTAEFGAQLAPVSARMPVPIYEEQAFLAEPHLNKVVIDLENGQKVYRIRAVETGDEMIVDMAGKLVAVRDAQGRTIYPPIETIPFKGL